ncbi:MAG: hypothetical protein IJL07_08735 [Lachnospiraceae bacterium]|nr:hypothetical protein [Lachnospiraceae bacterium]
MKEEYVKKLDFDSDTFEQMKVDMNFVLQRLLGNMLEKGTNEGSMTIKIDVTMIREFIPNYDPDVEGESREVSKPQFKHKVTSAVKINDEKSGKYDTEMELVLNENGIYELRPIANTQQRTIFDSDFGQYGGTNEDNIIDEGTYIEGTATPLLPGPSDEEDPEDGIEDITDELLGDEGYDYEDPEDKKEGDEE